jgi:putative flippase GtrA
MPASNWSSRMGRRPPWASVMELVRYLACSAAALAGDCLVYDLALRLGLGFAAAAALGFSAGLVLAYRLSVRWAFTHRRLNNTRREWHAFALIGLLGLCLTEVLLLGLIGHVGLDERRAKLAAAGFVFVFNFGARKLLLFSAIHTKSRDL